MEKEKSFAKELLEDLKMQNKRIFIMWLITFLALIGCIAYIIYLYNDKGTYLVTMAGHITVIKDGIVYDTFDCRNRQIWDVWEVNNKCYPVKLTIK